MFFNRPPRPPRRPLLVAERFVSPVARLSGVDLPLDVVARRPAARLRFVILPAEGGADRAADDRTLILSNPDLRPEESLRLEFTPFEAPAGTAFLLGAFDLSADAENEGEPLLKAANDLRALRAATAGRPPIGLVCRGAGENAVPGLLTDERGMAAVRIPGIAGAGDAGLRVCHGLDAFWCDAHGLFLRGWIHAHEHRVRALRIESAGRSARVDTFTDRPDLLAHYPEHEHVRHAGFAVYLACPPAIR